jgi:hypothetical protein
MFPVIIGAIARRENRDVAEDIRALAGTAEEPTPSHQKVL